jgi:hypothetical protein
MRAFTVQPKVANSGSLREVPEILEPTEAEHLILGHESLGEVLRSPSGSGFQRGNLVVGRCAAGAGQRCGCAV